MQTCKNFHLTEAILTGPLGEFLHSFDHLYDYLVVSDAMHFASLPFKSLCKPAYPWSQAIYSFPKKLKLELSLDKPIFHKYINLAKFYPQEL